MATIDLGRGFVTLVDDDDLPLLSPFSWRWRVEKGGYRYAVSWTAPRSLRMHRVVMRAPDGFVVDHINGDTLDNRRENLRVCTIGQNLQNSRTRRDGFKGVYRDHRGSRWAAEIQADLKRYYLGGYSTEVEAARAYDAAAILLHGEFARLNFPANVISHDGSIFCSQK